MGSACSSITTEQRHAVGIINIASAALSVLGSGANIVAFLLSKEKSQQLFHLIFFLSIADFLGSALIILSQGISYLIGKEELDMGVCIAIRAVFQYFFLASFCWTSAIAFHLYRAANHLPEKKSFYLGYHLISWGLPGVMIAFLVIGKHITRAPFTSWCDLSTTYEWIFWFTPLILSLIINLVFYVLIVRSFRKTYTTQRKFESRVLRRLSYYLISFCLCWIWDIINHIILTVSPECNIYPLLILQVIFAPLQGFLNFIVYGISNQMFRCKNRSKTPQLQRWQSIQTVKDKNNEVKSPLLNRESGASVNSVPNG